MKLKRILATVLALAMVLSMMSFSALATGDSDADNAEAMFNDEYYSTVAKALAAATESGDEEVTITILKDVANLPQPTRAGLTFKAAAEGIKVTNRANLPNSTKFNGTITWDGFDFTAMSDWAFCPWDTNNVQGFDFIIKNCKFGNRAFGMWEAHEKYNFESLTVDNCKFYSTADTQINIQYGKEVIVKNCDFSESTSTSSAINMQAYAGNLTIENNNFGDRYVMLSQNLGDINRTLTATGNTFTGTRAVRLHSNVNNNLTTGAATKYAEINLIKNTVSEDTALLALDAALGDATTYVENNIAKVTAAENVTADGAAVTEIAAGYTPASPAAKIGDTYYFSLQAALDAVAEGDNTITLLADVSGDVIVHQSEGINITIDGNDHKFDGIIDIYGHARSTGEETLTIQNVDFYTESEVAFDFITCATKDSEKRYAHNVTIKDCTFTANTEAEIVAMRFRQCYNINVENCKFSGLHSVAWTTGGGNGLVFDNIEATACKNGISTGTSSPVTVKNSLITATDEDGYAIRTDGSAAYSLTVEESTLTASYPVIVRKASSSDYELNIGEGTVLTATGEDGYDIVVTSGDDDEEFVKPENDINITVDKTVDADVFSSYVAMVDGNCYATLTDALKALKENSVLKLLSDVTITEDWDCRSTGSTTTVPYTFNGNGHTLKFTGKISDGYNHLAVFRPEAEATFMNLTVDMSEAVAVFQNRFSVISSKDADLTVTDCSFIGNEAATRARAIIFGETASDNDAEIVVSGCTFTNFKYGVVDNMQENDVAVVEIKDSEFTNSIIQVSASESVTLTGNTFDGGYFNITSYTQPNELAVTVTENTLDQEYARYNVIQAGKTITAQEDAVMPKITVISDGETSYHYNKISDAVAGAQNGDVIDLNGNTFEITSTATTKPMCAKNLTIQNGTMDFTNASAGNSMFDLGANQTIKFKDMTLLIKDREEGSKMCYWMDLTSPTATAYFENCVIDFDAVQYSYISANGDGKAYFTDCEIEAEDANFIYRAGATFENCTFDGYADLGENEKAGNIIMWAAVPSVISNSTVYTRSLTAIAANGTISIENDSYVYAANVYHYYGADSEKYTAGLVTVDAASTLEAVDLDMGMINEASEGIINAEASYIYVQYRKVDLDEEGVDNLEGADKYEIVIAGQNNKGGIEKINELASADLTFDFVGNALPNSASMTYFVKEADGVSLVQLGDRYLFNYDGVNKYQESGTEIVIGTITVNGYGSYTLKTADAPTNAVYATEIRDNIVDSFETAAELVINEDLVDNDGMVGSIESAVTIAVPTRTLTVNIDFPNAVKDNAVLYQDMKVEITGNIDGVNKTVTYNLGTDEAAMNTNGSYVVREDRLVLNNSYTVTVSGAGYRTARYTVRMTDSKTLNFWNNVKDNDTVVEEGKYSEKKNFLAGDIVKDNQINIYDLSAVVSYFATTNDTTAYSDYAKYDLNRDGVIDAKDVAYVLVSWGE